MRRIGRVLVKILAVIGLLTVAGIAFLGWMAGRIEPALPKRMVLTLDLEGDFREAPDGDPFARLAGRKSYVLRETAAAIDRAGADPRVAGLFATIGSTKLGMAGVQEIRDAVKRFRASGKPAVLFAETIGDFGKGTVEYYLASAFGELWLQPSGDVAVTGFMAESPFIKGTLDMLGIQPQVAARWQYKSAIEIFTEKGFSQPHRENLGALLDSFSAQAVEGIAEARRLQVPAVQAAIAKAPLLAGEALAAGLVDKLGYRDEALATFGDGPKPKEVDLADYAARTVLHTGGRIAVITGVGDIHRGPSDGPFGDDQGFGSTSIAKAFREAAADPEVKAIVLRIDSPGGSYVASDTVWREVARARRAGKPVVASMGGVAASGGYFVAMAADRVVAQPGTITGSIGVFAGKAVLADFWSKLGISWDEMHRGDNATMWSFNKPFTPEAWERVNAMLDHIYADFTTKAMEGRGIPADRIDSVARGRVWSGADAKRLGLVDALGGFDVALNEARRLGGLAVDAPVDLVAFPHPKKPWEVLAGLASAGGIDGDVSRRLAQVLAVLEPLAVRLGGGDGAQLRLPPGDLVR